MSRHKARQEALELLYSREFHGENDIQYSEQEILENDYVTTDALTEDGPELSDQERNDYCTYLVETTTEHRDELDTIIRSFAKGWDIERDEPHGPQYTALACANSYTPRKAWRRPSSSMKRSSWPRNSAATSRRGSLTAFWALM